MRAPDRGQAIVTVADATFINVLVVYTAKQSGIYLPQRSENNLAPGYTINTV